ncbi:very short patch repair endonuclease [Streptomyces neyagawaensis]|nr:very short patch repair endonuclease [Streptomyces neyagawaensis]
MSRQVSRDTAPEVAVRRLLYAAGLRYRLNVPVPGMRRRTIDIALSGSKIAVFLDGCFWHGCPDHATQPKSNTEWWRAKLDKNMARDRETTEHLQAEGWTVLRFWEHENPQMVAQHVIEARRRTPHAARVSSLCQNRDWRAWPRPHSAAPTSASTWARR